MNTILSIFITVIFTFLFTINAAGQTVQPDKQGEVVGERLQVIETMLNESRFSNSLWWYGWMGAYGAASAVSFTIASKSDDDVTRITQTVSGIESVIGLAGVILTPLPPAYAYRHLDNMPYSTQEDKDKKLSAAEGYLRETAQTQEFGASWVAHTLNFVVNASGGLVIWQGYDEQIEHAGGDPLKEGLLNFIIGFAVGEIQIFTQPTGGIRQWKFYSEKYNIEDAGLENRVNMFASANGTGILAGVTLSF